MTDHRKPITLNLPMTGFCGIIDVMKFTRTISFMALVLLPINPAPSHADWINLTGAENARNIAEIHIEKDHIFVKLEVFIEDLMAFEELIPDDFFSQPIPGRPPAAGRMKYFSENTFQVLAGDGQRLYAQLKVVEPRVRVERFSPFVGAINPATMRPVPGPPEDKRVLYAELIYPFEDSRPDTLTFLSGKGEGGLPAASIGFIVYQEKVPIIDFRFLAEKAVLHLDWEDPWYSTFENKALKRWQRGGVMSFLYIEPREVRHEILARVKDLGQWMDLGLKGDEYIEIDEIEPLKKRVGDFLLARNPVTIDGNPGEPILDRTAFVKWSVWGSQFIIQPERMRLNTAMIGVILTFLTDEIPQEVTVDWEMFTDRIPRVPTNAIDPAGPFPSYVTADDNVFRWTNFLKRYTAPDVVRIDISDYLSRRSVPVGTILCLAGLLPVGWQIRSRIRTSKPVRPFLGAIAVLLLGGVLLYPYLRVAVATPASLAPAMTNDQAKELLHSLLKNVYRAFDFRDEEVVYDKLARSAAGDLLEEIYLQNRRSFVVARAGGAQARVEEVEVLDVSAERIKGKSLNYLLRSRWTATGSVGHWGHIHMRKNRYEADITVEPVDGTWKITDLQVLEEERIDRIPPLPGTPGNQ